MQVLLLPKKIPQRESVHVQGSTQLKPKIEGTKFQSILSSNFTKIIKLAK